MLLVVITPSGSTLEKHLSITLALTHRMPDGIAKRPRISLAPNRNGFRKNASALPYVISTRESVVIESPNSLGYGLRRGPPAGGRQFGSARTRDSNVARCPGHSTLDHYTLRLRGLFSKSKPLGSRDLRQLVY